jgi:hypothetical protein
MAERIFSTIYICMYTFYSMYLFYKYYVVKQNHLTCSVKQYKAPKASEII